MPCAWRHAISCYSARRARQSIELQLAACRLRRRSLWLLYSGSWYVLSVWARPSGARKSAIMIRRPIRRCAVSIKSLLHVDNITCMSLPSVRHREAWQHMTYTDPTDEIHNWRVELSCSVPNTVTVYYTDYRGLGTTIVPTNNLTPQEVRLECNNQVGKHVQSWLCMLSLWRILTQCLIIKNPLYSACYFRLQGNLKVSCSGGAFGGVPRGGPYTFVNLSESGILPGWTCSISGCFEVLGDYLRTPTSNCTLPGKQLQAHYYSDHARYTL